jgi:hypothetical protein
LGAKTGNKTPYNKISTDNDIELCQREERMLPISDAFSQKMWLFGEIDNHSHKEIGKGRDDKNNQDQKRHKIA